MNLTRILLRYRFIVLNLLFMVYLWIIQPVVLARINTSATRYQPDWWMGGLLLGIQLLEIVGFLFKEPVSRYLADHKSDPVVPDGWISNTQTILLIFTPILHLGFSSFLTLIAWSLLFPSNGEGTSMNFLLVVVIFLVITKEAVFIVLLLSTGTGGVLPLPLDRDSVHPILAWLALKNIQIITLPDTFREIAGDFLLLIFSALSYTALWEYLISSSPIHSRGGDLFYAYLGASILFVLVYVSTRSVYLMQEISALRNRIGLSLSAVSFLAVWISALLQVPVVR
jgi:hypothetical protein